MDCIAMLKRFVMRNTDRGQTDAELPFSGAEGHCDKMCYN